MIFWCDVVGDDHDFGSSTEKGPDVFIVQVFQSLHGAWTDDRVVLAQGIGDNAMKLTGYAALLVVSFVLVSVSQAARAQDAYVALSAGQAHVRTFCEGVPISCDDTAIGFKAFVGYNFTPNIGAEFGYVDMGKAAHLDLEQPST